MGIGSQNISVGENVGIGKNAHLSSPNAKIIINGNSSIAENFTVHTGNHVHLLGKFISDITDENKPEGFDKDVIVNEDVWIGCNVTLLSGVTLAEVRLLQPERL